MADALFHSNTQKASSWQLGIVPARPNFTDVATMFQDKLHTFMGWSRAAPEDAPGSPAAKAPEQGYSGKEVSHPDRETVTSDWRQEYGKREKPAAEPAPDRSGSVQSAGLSLVIG